MVSVVIASYNHQHFIAECINCVLTQTYQDFEIVIVDDGSTDETWNVISTFQDSRIKATRLEKNVGACEATNIGLKVASKKYICILSSDDNWKPTKLEKQVHFLENNPEYSAVFGWADFIDDTSNQMPSENDGGPSNIFRQQNRLPHEWTRYFFSKGNCLCHPTLMIRRECYDKIGLYDNRFRQIPDLKMWINFVKHYRFHIIEEAIIDFRIHGNGGNTSSPTPTNTRRTWNEHYLLAKEFFKDLSIDMFYKAFSDELVAPHKNTHEHMMCEQAFLFLKPIPGLSVMYKVAGMELLYDLLNQEKTRSILKNDFNFETKQLHELSAGIDTFYNPDQQVSITNAPIAALFNELTLRARRKTTSDYKSFIFRRIKDLF